MKEGDVVKLGRVRFRVRQLCADSEKQTSTTTKGPVFLARKASQKPDESLRNIPICRICLCENSEEDNPLINPCRCAGTMKYVHIKCLQQWLKSRLQTKNTAIAFTIAWKSLDCELCSRPFPSIVELDGVKYYPLDLPRTEAKSYIVLEVLGKDSMQVRGLHFINMSVKPQIKLGRGHESDVRIADISVSRFHATVSFDGNSSFYISDNDSKFGTLVQLKKPFALTSELNGLTLQVGRTSCNFNINTKSSFSLGLNSMPNAMSGNRNGDEFDLNAAGPDEECDLGEEGEEARVVVDGPEGEDRAQNILAQLLPGQQPGGGANNANGEVQNINIEELLYENENGANNSPHVNNNNLVHQENNDLNLN